MTGTDRRPLARVVALAAVAAVVSLSTASCSGGGSDGPQARSGGDPAGSPGAGAPANATTTTSPPPGSAVMAPPSGEPEALADTLVSSERAIRDPRTPPSRLESTGQAQQNAYRQLIEHPEWLAQVLARVPPDLHGTVRANFTAGAELRALTKPRPALPAWRIVAPAPADELLGHYRAADAAIGVPWEYLAAIHLVETRMGRIRGTSVAGAQGPMQFIPETWRRYGRGDINSNRDAIFAAARLLKANGAPGDMREALYHYNPTPRYVTAVTNYAGQIQQNERAYFGYYHWQVYYRMVDGDRLLPIGYGG